MIATKYEVVVGLEVHAQIKTESKMFCGCSTDYLVAAANANTCPVCLAFPGALPVPNRKAIELSPQPTCRTWETLAAALAGALALGTAVTVLFAHVAGPVS